MVNESSGAADPCGVELPVINQRHRVNGSYTLPGIHRNDRFKTQPFIHFMYAVVTELKVAGVR